MYVYNDYSSNIKQVLKQHDIQTMFSCLIMFATAVVSSCIKLTCWCYCFNAKEIKDLLRRCDAQKVWSANAIDVMAQEAASFLSCDLIFDVQACGVQCVFFGSCTVSLEPFYAQAQSCRRGKSHSDILPMELVSYHMSLPLALARPIITSPVMRALTSMTFELFLQRSLVLVYWCMLHTVRNRNELNLSQQATLAHKANRTENRRHKRRQ